MCHLQIFYSNKGLDQWFATFGTRTPGGTRRTGWGYAKIILINQRVKIKTQKQNYEVLVYKYRLA
jgi:hypothetical protein